MLLSNAPPKVGAATFPIFTQPRTIATMKLRSIFSQIPPSIRVQGGKGRERESENLGEGQVSESRMTPRTWTEIHYETCVLLVSQKFIMRHYVCY